MHGQASIVSLLLRVGTAAVTIARLARQLLQRIALERGLVRQFGFLVLLLFRPATDPSD
jgi:hypothetical protein